MSKGMMIKNLAPRLPERGKIKIGAKGKMRTSSQGNEFQPPVKLDHFRITTLERGPDGNFTLDKEFHDRFGEKPTQIPVRLLYDDPALNFPTRYACFLGRTLWCSGDGEVATRLSEEAPKNSRELRELQPNPHEVKCPCFRQNPAYQGRDKCKMNGNLSVIIDGMSGLGGVWNLRTTSYNSIVGILSSMGYIRLITGGPLANIPLKLRVQPKQATSPTDGNQVLIYVVGLEFSGDVAMLQLIGHQIALERATAQLSIQEIETEARRALQLAAPSDAPLPGDNADDVVEEFYPEQVTLDQATPSPPRASDFKPKSELFIRPDEMAQAASGMRLRRPVEMQPATADTPAIFATVGDGRQPFVPAAPSQVRMAPERDQGFFFTDAHGTIRAYGEPGAAVAEYTNYLTAAAGSGEKALVEAWRDGARLMFNLRAGGHDSEVEAIHSKYTELVANFDAAYAEYLAEPDEPPPPSEPEPPAEPEPPPPPEVITPLRPRGRPRGRPRDADTPAAALAVPLRKSVGQPVDWMGTAYDFREQIKGLSAAKVPGFRQANRQVLTLMRTADKRQWETVEHALVEREHEETKDAASVNPRYLATAVAENADDEFDRSPMSREEAFRLAIGEPKPAEAPPPQGRAAEPEASNAADGTAVGAAGRAPTLTIEVPWTRNGELDYRTWWTALLIPRLHKAGPEAARELIALNRQSIDTYLSLLSNELAAAAQQQLDRACGQ